MKFNVKIEKIGDGLGFWVPERIVKKLGLKGGEELPIEITKAKIKPKQIRYSLTGLPIDCP